MPSTEPRPSLRLSYRRADVAGFWILSTTALALSLVSMAAALGSQTPWAWGAAGGAVLLLPRLVWPPWFDTGIRAWNGLARRSTAALRTYVLKVCYHTLFAAVGRSGSALELLLPQASASRWIRRDRSVSSPDAALRDQDGTQWYHGLLACARTTGNRWVVCLLPLVLLLILLRDEQQESVPPGSTYTLY